MYSIAIYYKRCHYISINISYNVTGCCWERLLSKVLLLLHSTLRSLSPSFFFFLFPFQWVLKNCGKYQYNDPITNLVSHEEHTRRWGWMDGWHYALCAMCLELFQKKWREKRKIFKNISPTSSSPPLTDWLDCVAVGSVFFGLTCWLLMMMMQWSCQLKCILLFFSNTHISLNNPIK